MVIVSCQLKRNINYDYIGYSGIRQLEWDLRIAIREKQTGIYTYPNLGTKFSLKEGKFMGVFQVIFEKDTLFYCNYIDNLPKGRYIKHFYFRNNYSHSRILPLEPNIDFGDGKGFFDYSHQKKGIWIENHGNCIEKGIYKQNKKEGVWEEDCFSDTGSNNTKRKLFYRNDSLIKM